MGSYLGSSAQRCKYESVFQCFLRQTLCHKKCWPLHLQGTHQVERDPGTTSLCLNGEEQRKKKKTPVLEGWGVWKMPSCQIHLRQSSMDERSQSWSSSCKEKKKKRNNNYQEPSPNKVYRKSSVCTHIFCPLERKMLFSTSSKRCFLLHFVATTAYKWFVLSE